MHHRSFTLIFLSLLIVSCSTTSHSDNNGNNSSDVIYPRPDPEIQASLESYRDSLELVMGDRVAEVSDTIRFGQPESALGNIVSDALRFRAAAELKQFVHVGIIGSGSFKLFFEPGTLTRRDVYEFMPYENHLVVLTLSGEQLAELIDQVAAEGGAPLSGVRFRLDKGGRATGVLVNAEVIDLRQQYLVATSNYLADGGDRFSALWSPLARQDLDVSIRDLYIRYFRNKRELAPVTDGRIRE